MGEREGEDDASDSNCRGTKTRFVATTGSAQISIGQLESSALMARLTEPFKARCFRGSSQNRRDERFSRVNRLAGYPFCSTKVFPPFSFDSCFSELYSRISASENVPQTTRFVERASRLGQNVRGGPSARPICPLLPPLPSFLLSTISPPLPRLLFSS